MTPWLDDGDVRLYHGDALETLRELPSESVDCVVTSPPYWGLRDYGTGEWDGGDPDCDHAQTTARKDGGRAGVDGFNGSRAPDSDKGAIQYRDVCGKCGARRVDRQMGLEPTPDLFVQGMVELFREIRRVLAPHGTCWVNLGDSYAGGQSGQGSADYQAERADVSLNKLHHQLAGPGMTRALDDRAALRDAGLKPKDLVGIPWRVAFALQADGWWLRSDIIWSKPNPMPESVTDRPTKAHEYIFLLTKRPRYWFDTEAVREPYNGPMYEGRDNGAIRNGDRNDYGKTVGMSNPAGRNVRSVWNIATQPYPEAHFATYPEELARRCILAGCPVRVCRVCGKPSERIVERPVAPVEVRTGTETPSDENVNRGFRLDGVKRGSGQKYQNWLNENPAQTVGWSDCGHNNWRPGTVLDPFVGSGTTCKVSRDHQRHSIGIDLSSEYLELAARRLQQLSLLT